MSYKTKYELVCTDSSNKEVIEVSEGWMFCDNDVMEDFVRFMKRSSIDCGLVRVDGKDAGRITIEDERTYFEPVSDEYEPDMNFCLFDVRPCHDGAEELAMAVLQLINANKDLVKAKKAVPLYTAQWSSEDYYKDQLNSWKRAADKLHEMINK